MTPGTRLGPYEILAPVGAGGMGEVYRAHDSRLGRDVAIKVSAERFSERFEREARAVAALNHPNICTLHDVGSNYIVMELVEGESPKGPLSLDETLGIMRQIAHALDYAHEKGIIHRDLKPENIKITSQGAVKLLDFGLAKIEATPDSPEASGNSPTLSIAATQSGVILGTAGYMSPEQARGKRADKRADIWAFGVVFYELLTGERLFKGEDTSEILAAVIKEEPPWEPVPVEVRRLLQRCLEKDPRKRLRDIGDVWELLDTARAIPEAVHEHNLKWLWAAIFALMAVVAGIGLWATWRAPLPEQMQMRFEIYPPDKTTFAAQVDDPPAISPDGKRIAFPAMGQDGRIRIWIRDLDSLDARRVEGTEEAAYAFWSPDGRWLAFQTPNAELRKVAVSGGPPQAVCACSPTLKGTWSKDGMIVFGGALGIMKVSEDGGPVTPVTSIDPSREERVHLLPSLLPDGRHFLYSRFSRMPEKSGTFIGSLDAKPEQQPLQRVLDTLGGQYASGRVVFIRGAALMTQDFDIDRSRLTGQATQIIKVAQTLPPSPGKRVLASGGVGSVSQLTWFDRRGRLLKTIGEPGFMVAPRVSPDNLTVAFTRFDTGPGDIWLHEARRGQYQFSFNEVSAQPIWSPDGSHLAFARLQSGSWGFFRKAVNGVGNEELLDKTDKSVFPYDWSRDDKYLLYGVLDPRTKMDIWVLPLDGHNKAFPYLNDIYNEDLPRLSPNGQWLAYESDKLNGRFEVYVDTFTGDASGVTSASRGSWRVSADGGTRPVWSRNGRELFFINADRKMMAVDVISTGRSEFKFNAPKALFAAPISGNPWDQFDVNQDGSFLMPVPVQQGLSVPITVIVDWTDGLKK